ncbi:hypothetical protein [Streptomyces sp. NPDC048650]|uniref:hypothetical protein n=1 Tax=Streptomyces sp. NPDC048650 TaxID=3365583 RepID=UPI003714FB12
MLTTPPLHPYRVGSTAGSEREAEDRADDERAEEGRRGGAEHDLAGSGAGGRTPCLPGFGARTIGFFRAPGKDQVRDDEEYGEEGEKEVLRGLSATGEGVGPGGQNAENDVAVVPLDRESVPASYSVSRELMVAS